MHERGEDIAPQDRLEAHALGQEVYRAAIRAGLAKPMAVAPSGARALRLDHILPQDVGAMAAAMASNSVTTVPRLATKKENRPRACPRSWQT